MTTRNTIYHDGPEASECSDASFAMIVLAILTTLAAAIIGGLYAFAQLIGGIFS